MLLVYQAVKLVPTDTTVMNLQIHLFALPEVMSLTLRLSFALIARLAITVSMVLSARVDWVNIPW